MFWNKNDDINKDWKDYEKYKKEKEARDREIYNDGYPTYDYNENERHVHDDHCDIGLSPGMQSELERMKRVRAAIVFTIAAIILLSFAFQVVSFARLARSKKEKQSRQDDMSKGTISLEINNYCESDCFTVYSSLSGDRVIAEVEKTADSDLELLYVEFTFYDRNKKVTEIHKTQIRAANLAVGKSVTAYSRYVPYGSVSADVRLVS